MAKKKEEKPFGVPSSPFESEGPVDASSTGVVSGKSAPMDMPDYGGPMPESPFDTLENKKYHDKIKEEVGHPEGVEPSENFPFELPPPEGAEPSPVEPAPYEVAPPSAPGAPPYGEYEDPSSHYDEPAPESSEDFPFESAPESSEDFPFESAPPSEHGAPPSPYAEEPAAYPEPDESLYAAPEEAPPQYEGAPPSAPQPYTPSDIQMLARSVADGVREELGSKIDDLGADVDELKELEGKLEGVAASLKKIELKFEQISGEDLEAVRSQVESINALLSKALPALITEIRASRTKS